MQKIDIICHRYQLTQKDGYIKLDDVIYNIIKGESRNKILREIINNEVIMIDNEKYITQEKFKEACRSNNWYKTREIIYILNTDIQFNLIKFEDQLIHIILKNNVKYYRLFDIANILGYNKGCRSVDRINHQEKYKLKDLLDTKICTLFGTDSNTVFATNEGITSLLLKSRKCLDIREKLADKLGIKINYHIDKFIPKETQYLTFIKNCLPENLDIKYQYNVDGNLLDMYLPEYNIVVECDEFGHKKYNKEKEIQREEYIKNKLKCDVIRFNPDDKNFNIGFVVREIYNKIINKNNDVQIKFNNNDKKVKIKPKKIIIGNKEKQGTDKINSEEKERIDNNNIKYIKCIPVKQPPKNASKKLNKCLDCQTEIYQKNLRCALCNNKKKFQDNCKETNRPSYKDLIKNVDDIGYCATGRLYGVSDNAIRKWIKTYEKFNL